MRELILGADVGGSLVKFMVITPTGETVARGDIRTDPLDAERTLTRLAGAVTGQLSAAQGRLTAAGLACAGIVSARTGRLGRSPNIPGWEGADLSGLLAHAFGGLPGAIANDVNAALIGEHWRGAGRGCDDLVMVALGTGVGGAVLLGGRLITGTNDGAGEIGHMVLEREGPLCSCGNRGCLEAYAGEVGLVRRARDLVSEGGASAALVKLVTTSGADLRAAFREAGLRLGQALAAVINLVDPQRIIVGGGVSLAGELILAASREVIQRGVLAAAARETPVVPAELSTHAAALGAAVLARERKEAA
jgi:glucokinase